MSEEEILSTLKERVKIDRSLRNEIKAKIEEIKEEVKTCFLYGKARCCTNNCKEACFYHDVIDILQRLLEEKWKY